MRIAASVLGWLFILAALAAAGYEAYVFIATGAYQLRPLGQLWYDIDPGSLNMLQAGIERRLSPGLWDDVVFPLLRLPGWPVLAAIGLVLLLLARLRRKRRRVFTS